MNVRNCGLPRATTCAAFLWFTLAPGAPAQVPQDPVKEIREIVQRIDEQMRAIDRWLMQSGKKGESGRKGGELLDKGQQQSQKVVQDIDELIAKLEQMRQQSRSRSQSESQDEQQQQGEQQQGQPQQGRQGGRGNRQENPVPDHEQQGQQTGEPQQGQQPPGGQPTGPEQAQQAGENRPGTLPPSEGTERVPPGQGEGGWGDLQSYHNWLKNRGSPPQVPEKYRKYWEAYLKEKGKER